MKKSSLEQLNDHIISGFREKVKSIEIPSLVSQMDVVIDKMNFFYRYIAGLALSMPITEVKQRIVHLFQDLKEGRPQPKPYEEAYKRSFRLKPKDSERISKFETDSLKKFNVQIFNKFLILEALNEESSLATNKICEVSNYEKNGEYEFDNQNLCFYGEALLDLMVANWISFSANKDAERDYTKRELDILKNHFHDLVEYFLVDELDLISFLNTGIHRSLHRQERNRLGKGIYALLAAIYLDQYKYNELERFLKESVVTEDVLHRFRSVKFSHETECCFGSYICRYQIDGNTVGSGEGGDEFEAELDAKCKTFSSLSIMKAQGYDVGLKFDKAWLQHVPKPLLTTKAFEDMLKKANLVNVVFYSKAVKKNLEKELELYTSLRKTLLARIPPSLQK